MRRRRGKAVRWATAATGPLQGPPSPGAGPAAMGAATALVMRRLRGGNARRDKGRVGTTLCLAAIKELADLGVVAPHPEVVHRIDHSINCLRVYSIECEHDAVGRKAHIPSVAGVVVPAPRQGVTLALRPTHKAGGEPPIHGVPGHLRESLNFKTPQNTFVDVPRFSCQLC